MNKIKVFRAKNDLTQEKLAELCGLSRVAVNAIERSRAHPRESTKLKISRALGCPVDDLFNEEGEINDK